MFYARYGDTVAKPRAESKMRSFARQMIGSRAGYTGKPLGINAPPASGSWFGPGRNVHTTLVATPDSLYGADGGVARLASYWQQEDRLLDGTVDVGPLETVRKPPADSGKDMSG